MRLIPITFFLLICVRGFGQWMTMDAGTQYQLGVLNNVVLKMSISDTKKSLNDRLHQVEVISKTIQIINTIKEAKTIIGTVSATMGDLKSMSEQFFKDFRGIKAISEDEINRLTEIINFRDALKGRGYQSIFGAYDWYIDETARFRDRNGQMNIASAIMNASTPERALETYRSFQDSYWRMQREQIMADDFSILEDLSLARYYERQARTLTIMYRVATLGKSIDNIAGQFGGSINLNITKTTTDADGNSKSQKYVLTPEGLLAIREQIESCLEKASQKKREAFAKYDRFIAAQHSDIQLALMYQQARDLQKRDSEIRANYLNGQAKSITKGKFEYKPNSFRN